MTTPEEKQADTEQAPVKLAPSRKGRVYVAGPMTGIKDFNFPAFNQAAEELRTLGLTVLNPADHGVVEGATWADYLRHDIALLSTCERIHLLPGWPKSKGARLELHIAKTLGMEITTAPGAELVAEAELGEPWGSLMLGGSLTFHNVEFQANGLTDEQTSQTASVAGLVHRDVPEADFGNRAQAHLDTAALNWIERQCLEDLVMCLVIDAPNDGRYSVCGDSGTTHYGKTLREALASAMAEEA